ncbi:hypothetical protein I5M06_25455 [Pseudomonas aeruginosa]|nr:hypothetical protein [Pseudomonas aeruginosa]MBH3840838.1 hypothetical protein [Pseudomonas aeruginosa]HCL3745374.1 hypothetical protein [Pseudomonas aeruginosa]HEK1429694.1 hypothetical protein [Pseudomonas aeruginosa]
MISDRIRQSDLSGNDLGLAQAEDVSVMGDASALGILLNNLTAKRGRIYFSYSKLDRSGRIRVQ